MTKTSIAFKQRPSGEMVLRLTRYEIRRNLKRHRKFCLQKKSPMPNTVLFMLHGKVQSFWEDVETLFQSKFGEHIQSPDELDDDKVMKEYLQYEKKLQQQEEQLKEEEEDDDEEK